MNVAIIPARGGSKRISKKNIKLFAGKPIVSYSISAALECGLFDRVVVSTDDQEIASVAIDAGADVPFTRPEDLSDDYTGTEAVVNHTLNWLLEGGLQVDYACCIYATAPFVQSDCLIEGYKKLVKSDKSYVFSVTSFEFPIQRALRINDSGEVEPISPESIEKRSQDLEEAYHDAGQFYWGKVSAFLSNEPLNSAVSLPLVLPRMLVQDIDTLEDWQRAELMFQAWKLSKKKRY